MRFWQNNILIDDNWHPRLADFGLAGFMDETQSTQSDSKGSVRWMAPELLDPGHFGLRFRKTKASDMYALGCTFLEVSSLAKGTFVSP